MTFPNSINGISQSGGLDRSSHIGHTDIQLSRRLKIVLCGLFGLMVLGGLWTGLKVRPYFVPSGSMENTLHIGDRILVNESAYDAADPKDGQIVIFQAPQAALWDQKVANEKVIFIKRVVGTPGQEVEMINRKLYVNGAFVSEPFTRWSDELPNTIEAAGEAAPRYSYDMKVVGAQVYSREYISEKQPGPWSINGVIVSESRQNSITHAKPGKLPTGEFLVLGDHRNNSNDSHTFGFVARSLLRGRVISVFWPLSRRKSLIETPSNPVSSPQKK